MKACYGELVECVVAACYGNISESDKVIMMISWEVLINITSALLFKSLFDTLYTIKNKGARKNQKGVKNNSI